MQIWPEPARTQAIELFGTFGRAQRAADLIVRDLELGYFFLWPGNAYQPRVQGVYISPEGFPGLKFTLTYTQVFSYGENAAFPQGALYRVEREDRWLFEIASDNEDDTVDNRCWFVRFAGDLDARFVSDVDLIRRRYLSD